MASCSSSSHPLLHPYHDNQSQSTTSLESRKKRSLLSRLLSSSRREGLLPLPEGAHLSSSSPLLVLLTLSHMSLDLPHPVTMPVLQQTMQAGDSMWAMTPDPSPPLVPTATILGLTETTLQHPQPCLIPLSSETILPFHTVPTSL